MTFEGDLLTYTGQANDPFDVRAVVRRCFFYDFIGQPVRLWDGQGVLVAGGYEWLGTIDADGMNHHQVPAVSDARDGTAPKYEFTIPYLDQVTFNALKADQDRARGRDLICYHALFNAGDGLRPSTGLRFNYRLAIRGIKFTEQVEGEPGEEVFVRSVTAVAKSLEYGRSRVPGGTYTDTAQQDRARLLGLASDSGCAFMAKNSRRTFTIPGTP